MEANLESLKKLADALWNPEVPAGRFVMLARVSGKIEKYGLVRLVGKKDEITDKKGEVSRNE